MIRVSTLAALVALAVPALAQPAPDAAPVRGAVSFGGALQSYALEGEQTLRQVSLPLGVRVRHRSGVGAAFRGTYVTSTSSELATLSGLADAQLSASYRRMLGATAVEASLGASLPTGSRALTVDEFAMATALAFDDYAFDVPSLGQGFALSPGLLVVVPAGRAAAVGIGAAYYARSSYAPFADDTTRYAPADEVVLSGGLEAQIGRASTFALDVSMATGGEDAFGGRTFQPGRRLATTARWQWGGGTVRGHLLMRYRHIFDGSVPVAVGSSATRPIVDLRPSHALVNAGVEIVRAPARVGLSAGARYYGHIREPVDNQDILELLGEQQVLIDLGVAPKIEVSPGIVVGGRFGYTRGVAEAAGAPAITGFRAGLGIEASF